MRLRGLIWGMALLLAFQSVGYYVIFVTQVVVHRLEVADLLPDLPDEAVTLLQLTAAEYQGLAWDGPLEFWKDGVKHDLKVAQQTADGSWQVLCMRDERETRMLAAAGKTMQTDQDQEEQPVAGFVFWHATPMTSWEASAKLDLRDDDALANGKEKELTGTVLDVPAPPPQICG